MRQIVLDTETTGLETELGHRIIEIGAVELVDRRPTGNTFHQYINPDREIDAAAVEVHGITSESLARQPRFAQIAGEFLRFVSGAELVIHNAEFDVGFLDYELALLEQSPGQIGDLCAVLDTLTLARRLHPGQRNTLDALCRRYHVDNSGRDLHGALLDARLLAEVYLAMTGGQAALSLSPDEDEEGSAVTAIRRIDRSRLVLHVVRAGAEELAAHEQRLDALDRACGGTCVWRQLAATAVSAEAGAAASETDLA